MLGGYRERDAVAPVVTAGATTRTLVLPPGDWVDGWCDVRLRGLTLRPLRPERRTPAHAKRWIARNRGGTRVAVPTLDVSPHILASSVLLGLGAAIAIGCGGQVSARSPDTDGGGPAPGAVDSGGPDGSCPASYADIPQGPAGANTSCPVAGCSYFDQFMCFCNEGSGWECIESNCLCSSGDDGCVNQACDSDADCPSGQHCGVNLGSPPRVCSAGCEDGRACPAGATCKMFAP